MKSIRFVIWKTWDMVYPQLVGLRYIDKKGGNIFRVALRKYRGPQLYGNDGTVIHKGDLVGELHLNNLALWEKLKSTDHETKWAMIALQEVRQSLPALATYLCKDCTGKKMKAFVARTVLHRGSKPLGFNVQDFPPGWYSKIKVPYLRWIFTFCHPKGRLRLQNGYDKLVPKYVFISRASLIDRYLNNESTVNKRERDRTDFKLQKLTELEPLK